MIAVHAFLFWYVFFCKNNLEQNQIHNFSYILPTSLVLLLLGVWIRYRHHFKYECIQLTPQHLILNKHGKEAEKVTWDQVHKVLFYSESRHQFGREKVDQPYEANIIKILFGEDDQFLEIFKYDENQWAEFLGWVTALPVTQQDYPESVEITEHNPSVEEIKDMQLKALLPSKADLGWMIPVLIAGCLFGLLVAKFSK